MRWNNRSPGQRQVRFASQLEPPFSDMEDETYFRKRGRSESSEASEPTEGFSRDTLCICMLAVGLICMIIMICMVIYFSLRAEREKE